VVEIDLVFDALRAAAVGREPLPRRERLSADLSAASGEVLIPLADGACSAVLASLLISYVSQPDRLLRDVLRVLKPGGRFVVSTLRRDADLSLIWAENERALRASIGASGRGDSGLDESLRSFFNDAARLMLLEEDGLFRFWEPQELEDFVRFAGFSDVRHELALGIPPQAIIVSGTRP
jgi:SAM-dependent methyltransferase